MVVVAWAILGRVVAKAAVDLAAGNCSEALKGGIDAVTAVAPASSREPTAEEGARLLLQRAAYAATVRVIQAHPRLAPVLAAEADPREIEAALSGFAAAAPLELTAAAFTDPERWPSFPGLLDLFDRVTKAGGVDEETRPLLCRAFAAALPLTMAAEWRAQGEAYRAVNAAIERPTPFDEAERRALDWRAYRDRLIRAVDTPLRSLAPERIRRSLRDLYVPLRAAPGDPDNPEARVGPRAASRKRRILWLDAALHGWATRQDPAPRDAFLVLSGEPGAGKSSACAILAAQLAAEGRRVLLVPLARLSITGDSRVELSDHVMEELGHDALDHARRHGGEPLVLILDGLDELAKAGQGATALLGGFIGQLANEISVINRDGVRVRLLLAGRPGAASATESIVRAEDARLHVLRYVIPWAERGRFDNQELAGQDQREEWWRRFDPDQGMPESLRCNDPHIVSLTEQPLLNWLLAQILTLEGPETAAKLSNRHELYTSLFDHVLSRAHRREDGDGSNEAIDAAGRERLERMLEEVAIAAWHAGSDRAVPLPVVEARLREAGLAGELDRLSEKRDHALTALLDSFFCRGHQGTEHRVVEFTHKSFGQFLTARRLVREIEAIHQRLGSGSDSEDAVGCLSRWLKLCGPATIDRGIFDFLQEGVQAAATAERKVVAWHGTLVPLFTVCMADGMPLPAGETRGRAVERQTRNAEVGLLAMLSVIIRATGTSLPRVKLPHQADLVPTLHRLFGPPGERSIARQSLNALELTKANLLDADLRDVDLTRANLEGANLMGASLWGATLDGANLRNAALTGADLRGARLLDSNLWGANLSGTDMRGALLMGADLRRSILTDTAQKDTDFTGADLTGSFKE